MKHRLLFVLTLLIFVSCKSSQDVVFVPPANLTDYVKTISSEGLRTDLSILASDSLQGRDTGTEGMDMAADYLVQRYKMLGLTPVGDTGGFIQNYGLTKTIFDEITYTVTAADGSVIDKSTHSANELANFATLIDGGSYASGEMVFIGYGLKDEEAGINQFPEDVEGKWLLTFYERGVTDFNEIRAHIGEDKALGALLIMGLDEEQFVNQATRLQGDFGSSNGLQLSYLKKDGEFSGAINRVAPSMAATLLQVRSQEELAAMEAKIKENPTYFEPRIINTTVTHDPKKHDEQVNAKNVVAFIEGTDSTLKNEVIVVSAHFDHVGIGRPDSTGDSIYNGADDDGSGTVGVLHVAQALKSAQLAGAEIKRSVLFLHVSGEEKGLLGSRYYSDHPIFDVDNTIANINIDMIGRLDNEHANEPDYVYVIGGKLISSGLNATLQEANTMSVNIDLSDRYNDLEDPNQFYRRSDHWNFGRLGVPFVFLFNGTHADYHRPSDEVDKINFDALTKRTKLIFMTTALLANSDDRPEVDNQAFIEKTQQNPR